MKKVFIISWAIFFAHSCNSYNDSSENQNTGEVDSTSTEWMSILSKYTVLTADSALPQFSFQLDELSGEYYSMNLNVGYTYDIRRIEGKYFLCVFNDWRFSFFFGGPEYFDHYIQIPDTLLDVFHDSEIYDDYEIVYLIEKGQPTEIYSDGYITAKYCFYGNMKALKYKLGDSDEIIILQE